MNFYSVYLFFGCVCVCVLTTRSSLKVRVHSKTDRTHLRLSFGWWQFGPPSEGECHAVEMNPFEWCSRNDLEHFKKFFEDVIEEQNGITQTNNLRIVKNHTPKCMPVSVYRKSM